MDQRILAIHLRKRRSSPEVEAYDQNLRAALNLWPLTGQTSQDLNLFRVMRLSGQHYRHCNGKRFEQAIDWRPNIFARYFGQLLKAPSGCFQYIPNGSENHPGLVQPQTNGPVLGK